MVQESEAWGWELQGWDGNQRYGMRIKDGIGNGRDGIGNQKDGMGVRGMGLRIRGLGLGIKGME